VNLRITLEPSFPQSAPTIQLLPEGLTHPFITDRGFVKQSASKTLQIWTLHSDLGKLIQELVQEFQKNEPQKRGETLQNQYRSPVPHPAPRMTQTDLKPNLPELQQLSVEQMTALMNDEQKFREFMNNLESYATSFNLRNDLIKSNTEEKEKQSLLKSQFASVENEIKEQNQKGDQLRSLYNDKLRIQESIMSKLSPQSLAKALTDKAQILDDQCEEVGEKFSRGELSLDKFLSDRKDYHSCLLKAKSLTNSVPLPTAYVASPYYTTPMNMGTWRPNVY